MNFVCLIGRWTRDCELRYAQNGTAVNKNTIALDRYTKPGEKKEADFLPVVMLGKLAENVAAHSGKGRLVCVTGKVQTRSYDKDGEKRYVTEILADKVTFLDYPKDSQTGPKELSPEDAADIFGGEMDEDPFK